MIRTPGTHRSSLPTHSPYNIPVTTGDFSPLPIRVYSRVSRDCNNCITPHRRDFYQVLMITKGEGMLTVGARSYYIDEPVLVLIHPADVISWKSLSVIQEGFDCLFTRRLLDEFPLLKTTIEKYQLFDTGCRNIIRLAAADMHSLNSIFSSMQQEELTGNPLHADAMQTYLQLLLIQCARITDFKAPDHVSDEDRYVHAFFSLLEREITNVHYATPIAMKTAKEFAANLHVHPNYLNSLLKKRTGLNISTHIRNRLLEVAKQLLLQTDWTLQDIGYSIGFAEQPNFSSFFRKNAGMTPASYRKMSFGNKEVSSRNQLLMSRQSA
ncbi:AraC family transcriptional regulator [Chitinophaga rhizophila]|uniref:AraC family transcriptional regulator n=1 Tax=Chitinophaga rhizophila TaxID=2866212 RepID=A0ABS7GMH5_9BACT|nr:AraC family transcriptional regulator [Chitinophaga rhizophila]MBW8688037.1 AraC family transcriptional regulator [Chitinophaga rhizophila]